MLEEERMTEDPRRVTDDEPTSAHRLPAYEPPVVEDLDTASGPAVTAALVATGVR